MDYLERILGLIRLACLIDRLAGRCEVYKNGKRDIPKVLDSERIMVFKNLKVVFHKRTGVLIVQMNVMLSTCWMMIFNIVSTSLGHSAKFVGISFYTERFIILIIIRRLFFVTKLDTLTLDSRESGKGFYNFHFLQ